jgi:CBS domain-containing protein
LHLPVVIFIREEVRKMTAQQLLHSLGFDWDDAADRLNDLGRRAQRTGTRMTRQAQRRGSEMVESVPTSYVWFGVGLVGAAVLASLMRNRLAGSGRARHVREVMVKDVLTIEGSATLQEAAQRMRDGNVGALPVVENGRLRGVITDRDIVVRGIARGMDVAQTPVRYIATEDLACASPDWDVAQAMEVMADAQIGRLPVVDDEHRVIGIVTLSSLALRSRGERGALRTAQEVSKRSARSA